MVMVKIYIHYKENYKSYKNKDLKKLILKLKRYINILKNKNKKQNS
jgi:hypothetical protein